MKLARVYVFVLQKFFHIFYALVSVLSGLIEAANTMETAAGEIERKSVFFFSRFGFSLTRLKYAKLMRLDAGAGAFDIYGVA